MKLTEKERRILSCIQLDASRTVPEVAGLCGYRPANVQECLDKLRRAAFLSASLWINWGALGFTPYRLCFSVECPETNRPKLLETLSAFEFVRKLGVVGGDRQFEAVLLTRSPAQLAEQIETLSLAVEGRLTHCRFAAEVCEVVFGSRFLAGTEVQGPPLIRSSGGPLQTIDELDHGILRCLARQSRHSLRAAAVELGEPHSTISYRFERLRRNKVVLASYYVVRPEHFGMLPFVCRLRARGRPGTLYGGIYEFCRKHPNIDVLFRLVGEWDIQLTAQLEAPEQAPALAEQLHARFGAEIDQLAVFPFFKAVKNSCYPLESWPAQG